MTLPNSSLTARLRPSRRTSWILSAVLVAGLTACASATPPQADDENSQAYDQSLYAAATCVDSAWTRVPDDHCPIGDEPVPGHPYFWVYREYRADEVDLDVVFVGYPVDQRTFRNIRPKKVSTLHIDRGRFPEKSAPDSATASSTRVPSTPTLNAGSATVQRGGLGVPTAPREPSLAPTPTTSSRSAAPAPAARASARASAPSTPSRAAHPAPAAPRLLAPKKSKK